jgi:hypothetical protein
VVRGSVPVGAVWIVTLIGGLLAIPLTGGASIALFLAGALTGLIARLMYG